MHIADDRKTFEKRKAPRQNYSGHILFSTKHGLWEGILVNFSRDGLFIEAGAPLSIGEIVTFAIPYPKNINYKRRGVIVWCNGKGFGVNLLEESNYNRLSNVIPFKI
jgi:hypothetical protein